MQYPGVYQLSAAAPPHDGTPVMAISYRQQTAVASIGKGRTAPYNTPVAGVIQPNCVPQDQKLLDQFRDKMRSLHYALATEKAYRHWIVEFLRFHPDGDNWKHPARWANRKSRPFLPTLRPSGERRQRLRIRLFPHSYSSTNTCFRCRSINLAPQD